MQVINERIVRLREKISEHQIDAFLVLIGENRVYLSNFQGEEHQFDESAGALLISADHLILATDSRFETQARQEAPLYEVVVYRKGLAKELPALLERLKCRRLGFESARVSVDKYKEMKKELGEAQSPVELVPITGLVESLRVIKSEQEIEKTAKALDLAEKVFLDVLNILKPGMTEKEVAWAMEKGMREAGAQAPSFPTIIAAGPNSALPHAIPTDRPIQQGEPVLFDWGAKLDGYCSDSSRTVFLGKPNETFMNVFNTVLEAQQRAIAAIRADVTSVQVDKQARDYIHAHGFEGKFGHGLGHGTGLAVHEEPRLSPLKETLLLSGMLVTVEPGIYLPGWGGVRIENQVVVEPEGARVLNRLSTSYDPQVLMRA